MLIHFLLTVTAFATYVLLLWVVSVASEVRSGQPGSAGRTTPEQARQRHPSRGAEGSFG